MNRLQASAEVAEVVAVRRLQVRALPSVASMTKGNCLFDCEMWAPFVQDRLLEEDYHLQVVAARAERDQVC